MTQIKSIIIEGVDRLGKDSLISGLKHQLGQFQVVHYQKPELLDIYVNDAQRNFNTTQLDSQVKNSALKSYQIESFRGMFHMLSSDGKFILNRAHLGEFVYSPRYRQYDGSYVFDLEQRFINDLGSNFHETTLLVLLHTSDFSFIKDDGLSFDFDKKEEEQIDFIRAFERSHIKNKLMLDVCNGSGNFTSKQQILSVVVSAVKNALWHPQPVLNVKWAVKDGVVEQVSDFQPDPKGMVF